MRRFCYKPYVYSQRELYTTILFASTPTTHKLKSIEKRMSNRLLDKQINYQSSLLIYTQF
jgi:hypothetical protein